jgi:hypothetical protein
VIPSTGPLAFEQFLLLFCAPARALLAISSNAGFNFEPDAAIQICHEFELLLF